MPGVSDSARVSLGGQHDLCAAHQECAAELLHNHMNTENMLQTIENKQDQETAIFHRMYTTKQQEIIDFSLK